MSLEAAQNICCVCSSRWKVPTVEAFYYALYSQQCLDAIDREQCFVSPRSARNESRCRAPATQCGISRSSGLIRDVADADGN
jgi:hypothetical protein